MVKVDLETRRIEAGVRDLIASADVLRRHGSGPSSLRAQLGSEVHARYRTRREAEFGPRFAAERAVEIPISVDGFLATVRGRIDGTIEMRDGLVIEEVKSVIELNAAESSAARLQVAAYALALLRAGESRVLDLRVVLTSLVDDAERSVTVRFDPAATEARLLELLRGTIDRAERTRRRMRARAAWAATMSFPHAAMRTGQVALVEAIDDALASGRPLLAEAPTGTGKTAAALFSALRFAGRRGARVLYVTPKTTQHEHIAATFVALCRASAGATDDFVPPPLSVSLHARARMCRTHGRPCDRRTCPSLEKYAERAPAVLAALAREHRYVGLAEVTQAGHANGLCPYELAFDLAEDADLVVGDYNYVYDPGIALLSGSPRQTVVVVDEAHNLFDRGRAYCSASLATTDLRAAQRALSPVDPLAIPLTEWLQHAQAMLTAASTTAGHEDGGDTLSLHGRFELTALPYAVDALADSARPLLLRWLVGALERPPGDELDPVAHALRSVVRMREATATLTDRLIPYAIGSEAEGGPGLGVLCVDPGAALARRHGEAIGTIAMSATLSPLEYWSDVLGLCTLDAITVRVQSPFSPDQRRVVIVPSVSTTYRDRDRSLPEVARLISQSMAARAGPYLVFFPSFAYLAAVRPRLQLDGEILVQPTRASLADRRAVLGRFRAGTGARALLAVGGGVFAEGIDLPGDQLLGAIVVGPCLPPVGFERAAMARHFEATRQAGFAYAMLYPGLQRVVQAAGRVIRREDDLGVVVLIGRRFARPEVIECLPEDWYRYDPAELMADDPIEALRQFWDR